MPTTFMKDRANFKNFINSNKQF